MNELDHNWGTENYWKRRKSGPGKKVMFTTTTGETGSSVKIYSSWSSEVTHVRFTFVFDRREEERGDRSTRDTLACFTCGSDLSPSACIFIFIRATFAAVPLVFAPFRPLLPAPPDLESKEAKACKYFLIAISRFSFFYFLLFLFLFFSLVLRQGLPL